MINRRTCFNTPMRKGLDYTERQMAILNDDVPFEQIRTTELSMLMARATEREDVINYNIAKRLYDAKTNPSIYTPSISVMEAKEILQSLTPWIVDWSPKKKRKKQKRANHT